MTNAIIFHAFEVVLLLLTLREIKGAEYIGCPPGWIHFTDTCYLIRGGHDSWDTADLQCKNYGAELAVLRYVEQQDFINSQLHLKCVDRDESCPQRANNGDCLKLGQLMKSSCPFSCGLCSSLCENAYDQPGICASRAAEGYCDIYPVIMMKDCMKSCGCNGYSDEYWVSESLAVYQWYEPRYIKKCVILRIQNGILYEAPCTGVAGYICEMKEQVLQLPAVDSSRTGCPVNGFGYKTKCYILNPAPHTWDEATQLCQERGGELASIPNKEVSQFISSELMTRHKTSWIGLSKNISNQFTWTNKEKVQYLPWQAPFDGRNTDNCVQLNTAGASGVFEPIQCEFELSSVCEIPRVLESPGMDEDTGLTVPLYDCPASWRQKDEFCYKLIPEQMSWQDAQDHCGEMNGDLTSIHNQDTQDFLKTLACDCSRPNPVWIGLHQNGRRENFEWSDGSPFDYFNWRDGLRSFNPYSETQKRCVQFECSRGCEWNDIPCDSKLQFVCQVWRAYPLDMETTRAGELFTTTDAEPATTAAATTKVDEPETTITSTTLVEEPETTTAAAKITTTPAEEPETTTAAATITTTPAEEPETTAAATVAVTTPADEPETTTTTPADEPVTTTTPADEPETTRTTQTTTVDETETTTAVDATTRDPEFHSTVVTDSTTEIPDIDTTAKLPNVVIDRTDRYPASDSNIIIAARDDTDSQQYGVQTANKEDKTGDSDNQGLLSIELLIGIFCAVVVAIFLLSVVLVFVSRHFKGPLIQNKNSVRYVNHKDENEYVDIMGPQSGGSEPTPDATPVMSQTSLEVEMYNNYVPSARDLDAGASLSFENSVYDMTR